MPRCPAQSLTGNLGRSPTVGKEFVKEPLVLLHSFFLGLLVSHSQGGHDLWK
jgi:hypothetical protein